MSPAPRRTAVRPPLQERSRRTLERILRATERLLEKRPFEAISVAQIVRGARTSVGSFYARFDDKSAMLTSLYERYADEVDVRIAAWQAEQGGPGPGLEGAAAWVAGYLIDSFRGRRNLLRALALHVRQHPGEVDEADVAQRAAQHRFLEQALLAHRDRIPDDDPERAVRSALFLAASACRERILFDDATHARSAPQSDAGLVADVTRMLAGYLLFPAPETRS
jgi:AcrR family transcriptional regulator